MGQRKEQTTYAVSNDLKAAMVAKGILIPVDVNQTYYSGGTIERHLIIADMSDGTFRTVVKDGSGVGFDFVDRDDAELVRLWTKRELDLLIGTYPGVSFSDWTKPGIAYIHVIKYNGVDYTGQDVNLPNAVAKAFINVLA